jgi:hypothetical protein
VRSSLSTSVPKRMRATYEAVVALTDAFCRDHLNDEYRDLARAMAAALCRKRPSPLASGQPRTWYWASSTSCPTRRASPP